MDNSKSKLTVENRLPRGQEIQIVCARVVEGRLKEASKSWGVPYTEVIRWINEDQERIKLYREAVKKFEYYFPRSFNRESFVIGGVIVFLVAAALVAFLMPTHTFILGTTIGYFGAQLGYYLTRRSRDEEGKLAESLEEI